MPLFEYRCQSCGSITEVLAREPRAVPCGRCAHADTVRLVSRFSLGRGEQPRYSDEQRERQLPFLKSRPGVAELLADGGGSEEAAAFQLTERIGQHVDSTLQQHVSR